MRDVLSMMIRRVLGVFGIIPAVSDKIDQIADAAVDKLEEVIPAVKQIDDMLGATSQRNGSSAGSAAGSSATDSTNGIGENGFNSQVLQSDLPVLVDFWAPWCGPCRQLSPSLEAAKKKWGDKLDVVKVNVDDNQAIAQHLGVTAIPDVRIFSNGTQVGDFVGVRPQDEIDGLLRSLQ